MEQALEFILSLSRLRRVFPNTINNKKAPQPRPHRHRRIVYYIFTFRLLAPQRKLDISIFHVLNYERFLHFVHTLLHEASG